MQESEQEILLNTLAETPQEEVRTLEEDIYVIGVESLNGKAGDLTLKNINGEDLVGTGNIALATQSAFNDLSATVATKQDALTETQLAAVNSGIDSSKVQQIADNTTAIAGKQDQLTQTQLNAVNSGIDQTKVAQIATNTGNITSNTSRITTIEGKIPSTASSSNKLTDKNYVDNAIATNTANYISDNGQPFQSYADLEAYSGPLTNNDYAFVETIDQAGNDIYTRYKYNADQELWAEEYTITNPYFTSDQWASINSGIAANDVTQIGTNKSDIASLQSGKQDALSQTQLDAVNSGIDATKVQQIATNAGNITSLQTDKQDKLIAGTNIQIAGDGKTISATDTTYTAGTGLTLTGTQFSVTEPVPTGFFTDTAATQEGTGTTITLNNTTDAPIDNVELKGDTYQFTTTGKNLLPLTAFYTGGGMYNKNIGDQFSQTYDQDVSWSVTNNVMTITTTAGFKGVLLVSQPLATGDYWRHCTIKTNSNIRTSGYMLDQDYKVVRKLGNYSGADTEYAENNPLQVQTGEKFYARAITSASGNSTLTVEEAQIELGTSYGGFEPYTAGASPNPSYPQDIQVVTGEQTVTVSDGGSNSQTYTIDLSATELCKIGTYQDYIYKTNGNWYKHAEVGKVVMTGGADETWSYNASNQVFVVSDLVDYYRGGFTPYCDYYKGQEANAYSNLNNYCIGFISQQSSRVAIKNTNYTSTANFKSWLSTHNTTAYYVLATATDTQITDAALIAQLDALAGSTTYAPQTNYTTSTASPNLPVILTVDVFKNNYAGLLARLNKAGA